MNENRRIITLITNFRDSKPDSKQHLVLLNHSMVSYSIYAARNSKYLNPSLIYTVNYDVEDCASYGINPDNCLIINFSELNSLQDYFQLFINCYSFKDRQIPRLGDLLFFINSDFPLTSSDEIDKTLHSIIYEYSKIEQINNYSGRLNQIFVPKPELDIIHNPFFAVSYLSSEQDFAYSPELFNIYKESRFYDVKNEVDYRLIKLLTENGQTANFPGRIRLKSLKEAFILRDSSYPYLLITCNLEFFRDKAFDYLSEFNVVYYPDPNLDETVKLLQVAKFLYWIPSPCPMYVINRDLLSHCNTLRNISTPSTGSTHIDVVDLKDKIKINTLKGNPKLNLITASSEWTFFLIMKALRKGNIVDESMKAGYWRENEDLMRGGQLAGKNIGIIGFGRIGSNLARYANSFLMNIYAFDIDANIQYPDYVNVMNSIDEVASIVDVFCVCIHFNSSTRKIINRVVLDKLKTGSILINTSRGEIVDEEVVLEKLCNGSLNCAAIDVIDGEADYTDSTLFKMRNELTNLILTPHVAGLSNESEYIAFCLAVDYLKQ